MSDINVGQFSEALNDKADRDLQNVTTDVDYVVESKFPTSSDPTWYRLYKSGWCEQGGYIAAPQNSDNNYAVTLLKPFADTNYQIQKTIHDGVASSVGVEWGWMGDKFTTSSPNTTTTLYLSIAGSSYCIGYYWEAKGMIGE